MVIIRVEDKHIGFEFSFIKVNKEGEHYRYTYLNFTIKLGRSIGFIITIIGLLEPVKTNYSIKLDTQDLSIIVETKDIKPQALLVFIYQVEVVFVFKRNLCQS